MTSLRVFYEQNIDRTISEINLAIRSKRGEHLLFVLVEGIDDVKVYLELFLEDKVMLRSTMGKNNIYKALEKLAGETKQCIAIRDADFYHLDKKNPEFESLFLTDKHDIEMTMLSFPEAVKKLLGEFLLQDEADSILLDAMRRMEYVSYIRWFNETSQCGLDFDFGIADFIKKEKTNETNKINAKLITALNSRSNCAVNQTAIDDFINCHRTDDCFNLCNGHDVLAFMALGISETTKKELPKLLRAVFKREYFFNTELYRNILEWQTKNGLSIIHTEQEALYNYG
jgi:hypothetical protein